MESTNLGPAFGVIKIAQSMGINTNSLRGQIVDGRLKAQRVGKPYVIYAADLAEYLAPRIAEIEARLICYKFTLRMAREALGVEE